MAKHNSDLFYTCSLIEYIGRERKLKRSQVVRAMGEKNIRRIYQYADVFHCEPIAKTADDFITDLDIPEGDFDNVSACRYTVPDYWTIGQVYERLIMDITGGDEEHVVDRLVEVYIPPSPTTIQISIISPGTISGCAMRKGRSVPEISVNARTISPVSHRPQGINSA